MMGQELFISKNNVREPNFKERGIDVERVENRCFSVFLEAIHV